MMMRALGAKAILALIIVAAIQLVWHAILANSIQSGVARFYLSFDPKVGKGVAGFFDVVIPAILLGFWVGVVGIHISVRQVSWCVVGISLGLVVLLPIYAGIFERVGVE